MSGPRVLHVISEMRTGGAESLVVEMVRRGPDVGWQSAVASHGGRHVEDLTRHNVDHYRIALVGRTIRGFIAARATTARAIDSYRPDIVLAHNVSATLVTRLAAPKVPVVTIFHGVQGADYWAAAKILTLVSDRVVAVSDAIGHRLKRAGLRRVGVTTIRNAVSAPVVGSRNEARASLNLPDDVRVVLCLARMERAKRHDILLDAWHRLTGDEILLLAGDGSRRAELEQQAYPLGDRVRFLGDRSDVGALLAAADVTVLVSDWEGMPMAMLESLAAARPVVATDVDGVREVLGAGGGRCVPAGDVDAIVEALQEMLHDDTARTEAAAIGLATVEQMHDPAQMMNRYDEVIRELLAEKGP